MADEKVPPEVEATAPVDAGMVHDPIASSGPVPRPAGWMYKGFKIFGKEIWYASPIVQLFMVAFVCFLCPGMFNALNGLGAAGQQTNKVQDDANTALYSTFAFVAFFSGTIANWLGLRLTLSLGGIGYCIYAASFLCYNHTQNEGFVVFAGAFLGVCAGLLWCGQGAIMMSYPTESRKGHYISWFWMIFNLGAVIGSLIPLGQNIHKIAGPVTDGTYVGFIVLMFIGAVLALFLCDASKVIREDGSKVILMKNPTFITEFKGLYETLVADPWIVMLFPMFLASNIFYTWQGNGFNAAHFNTRTRALNNVLYWLAQIIAASIFGYIVDIGKFRRSTRARIAFVNLFVLTMVIWGGGWAWERQQVDRATSSDVNFVKVDWTDGGKLFIGPMFLYFFMGFFDAVWQASLYWYMGCLSNSGRKTANLAGFYKGIQSAGAAIYWRIDGIGTEFKVEYGATWGLLAGSLVIAAPVIWLKIKDHISLEEDLKFSDETIEDVAPVDYANTTKASEV